MRTIKAIILIFLSGAFLNAYPQLEKMKPAPDGLTPQTVIDNYVNAIGGKEKLNAVKSVSTWAKSSIQGNDIVITIHNAVPNKFYFEMATPDISIQKQIFDGQKGMVIAMGNKMELQGEQLERMKYEAVLFKEMKYNELGDNIELLGIAELEDGTQAYKIKITPKSGNPVFDYYDVKSGLKIMNVAKIESPEGKLEIITSYKNYQPVKGILFPYTIIQEVASQTLEMNVTLITLNKAKDKIFLIQ
ncbi:MAG TPA: hypothetical protein P5050_05865 [Bacteroidia bacterium]|nr:hypothetical protein [Bacteroidia bacterium]HRS58731.1 hypothetical protein [Bacteroidia bacterium]HRU67935.1 hypothetical protein [Bacteroidia bacterium]